MNSISQLRLGASRLLAAAVLELFPQTLLVQGGDTSIGFYYDFIFPFAFQKEFLSLVEERMWRIVKEKRPLRKLSMVPKNAADFLNHKGQMIRAEAMGLIEAALVSLLQIDEFVDGIADELGFEDTGFLTAFKIQDVEFIEADQRVTRLLGAASTDKASLKEFLKKWDSFSLKDHLRLGEELHLFSVFKEGLVFRPKGEILRQILLSFFRNKNFDFVTTYSTSFEEALRAHRQMSLKCVRECFVEYAPQKFDPLVGLLDIIPCTREVTHLFDKFEECISCLQFMVKIPKIFGFESEVSLCSSREVVESEPLRRALESCQINFTLDREKVGLRDPRVEVRVKDALGRKWVLSFLEIKRGVTAVSTFVSLERCIALLLECHSGVLPFWLAPEQVRVIAIKGQAANVYQALLAQGVRASLDCRTETVGQRMHEALREKIPYVIFVGSKERESQMFTLRAYGSKIEERMSLENLISHFHALNRKIEFEN